MTDEFQRQADEHKARIASEQGAHTQAQRDQMDASQQRLRDFVAYMKKNGVVPERVVQVDRAFDHKPKGILRGVSTTTYTYSLQDAWIVQTTTGSGVTTGHAVTPDGHLCSVEFGKRIEKPHSGIQMRGGRSSPGRQDKFVTNVQFGNSEREIKSRSKNGMTTIKILDDLRSISWVIDKLPAYAASLVSGNGPVKDMVY